ncbi:hypothetical protein NOVO_01380 [Rickettsiales bacterium Ac37b]|nr:hypothetical protein NOVO_01380 [Rickettsiales bacterium Ac37b]
MQEMSILGVDISKKALDVCLHVGVKESHKVFHNNVEGFKYYAFFMSFKVSIYCSNLLYIPPFFL